MGRVQLVLLVLVLVLLAAAARAEEKAEAADVEGYRVFCLCMGRVGNQLEQLLGSLHHAKTRARRTLVLPPFVFYERGVPTFMPFADVFDLAAVRRYHPVIPMEEFMRLPDAWPADQRHAYCGESFRSCRMRFGNPSSAFWDHFGIEFVPPDRHFPRHSPHGDAMDRREHPVVATLSAPSHYPVEPEVRPLQKYLQWNARRRRAGNAWIAANLRRPFVAIHLRLGIDWQRVCSPESALKHSNYMASTQCDLGPEPRGPLLKDQCVPSPAEVVRSLHKARAEQVAFESVFVGVDNARDGRAHMDAIREAFGPDVPVVRYDDEKEGRHGFLMDLYVFSVADFFIGNCPSSFSSFATRHRATRGLPYAFFGFEEWTLSNSNIDDSSKKRRRKEEL